MEQKTQWNVTHFVNMNGYMNRWMSALMCNIIPYYVCCASGAVPIIAVKASHWRRSTSEGGVQLFSFVLIGRDRICNAQWVKNTTKHKFHTVCITLYKHCEFHNCIYIMCLHTLGTIVSQFFVTPFGHHRVDRRIYLICMSKGAFGALCQWNQKPVDIFFLHVSILLVFFAVAVPTITTWTLPTRRGWQQREHLEGKEKGGGIHTEFQCNCNQDSSHGSRTIYRGFTENDDDVGGSAWKRISMALNPLPISGAGPLVQGAAKYATCG